MSQKQWTAVDDYLTQLFVPSDSVLNAALQTSNEAGLPPINVSPTQGKLLYIIARVCQARSILEIGTLGGYSTIWLARALPKGGRLVTLELNSKHAEVARANIERANLSDIVEVRVGEALTTLPQLSAENSAPFDLVFIDADKQNAPAYFEWSLKLTRCGGLIITDNVIRNGAVIDAASDDINVQGVRELNASLAAEPRVTATAIQTVGSKGYDGFAIALITND
jgi:predicted O-methyltransferase YrrM